MVVCALGRNRVSENQNQRLPCPRVSLALLRCYRTQHHVLSAHPPRDCTAMGPEGVYESKIPLHREAPSQFYARAHLEPVQSWSVPGRPVAAAAVGQVGLRFDAVSLDLPLYGGEPRAPDSAPKGLSRIPAGGRNAAQ